ncbi:MAG: methyltransferase type 11 [Planctomycetaceae bacterium]|nr:methyltransferase type 11 [Planctomycetaceae bacterium]
MKEHSNSQADEQSRHLERIRDEFARQAEAFSLAPAVVECGSIPHFLEAVGNRDGRQRVLEVGCGPGLLAEHLAPLVEEYLGIDATPEMVELASQRLHSSVNASFKLSIAENLPCDAASFDIVVTRLTLHHLPRPEKALVEAHRVLAPGGRLFLADILTSEDPQAAKLHNALERLRDPTHVRMLTRAEMVSQLEEAGFHILENASWEHSRSFEEWAAIVADPMRVEPLATVMQALAQSDQTAGIQLRQSGDGLRFVHNWYFCAAQSLNGSA